MGCGRGVPSGSLQKVILLRNYFIHYTKYSQSGDVVRLGVFGGIFKNTPRKKSLFGRLPAYVKNSTYWRNTWDALVEGVGRLVIVSIVLCEDRPGDGSRPLFISAEEGET